MSNSLRYALLCSAGFAGLMTAPVMAAEPEKPIATIETVVVTAEKRAQNVQDVPIAMSAIGGEDLNKLGIRGLADLSFHTPALRFSPSSQGGENSVTLRGIGNVNVTAAGDSPVGYLVDGVYMGRTTSVDPEFFDISRIEVLRGPQGTLYGRNSVGGSINVITNQPTNELSGHVDALLGDYNARTFRAWANVPLYDGGETQILARVVGVSAKHDAYQKNLSTAPTATHNSDAQDYQMIRGHLLFKFNEDVDLLFSGSTSTNGAPAAFKIGQQWQPGDAYTANGATPNPTDPRKVYKDWPETRKQFNHTASATLNWNFGDVRFASITGWAKQRWRQTADNDGSDKDLSTQNYWQVSQRQYSQEFHLASNNEESPLKWIVGLFYFNEKAQQLFEVENKPTLLTFPYTYTSQGDHKVKSQAVFGQADYDLSKTGAEIPLTLTVGLRYTHDSKKGVSLATITAFGVNTVTPWKGNWGQTTGRIGLSYKITPDAMIYASASQGYMSGGYLNNVYLPETVRSYEAGFKTQWLDNRLQVNAAAYWSKVKNQQVFVLTPLTTRIENAASSKIKGLEFEVVAVPVEGLRLDGQLTLMDAKYGTYLTLNNRFNPGVPANFSGNRLVQTPKYTISLGAEYAIQTSFGTITPRVDTFISSDLYFLSANSPLDRQKSYTRTNLRVNWVEPQGRWNIEGFVANLENKDVISQDALQDAGVPGLGQAYDAYLYYPPRTVGVRFGVNF